MNITEFVTSQRWKKFMGYVYGWGASVVLMGALFKILHLQYAGLMLTVGMTAEAIIFFFSAFEPPHEVPDWSLVYPELIGLEPRNNTQVGDIEQLQVLLKKLNLQPDTLADLDRGLNKLSYTAEKLSDISDASIATENYVKNINTASESIGKFSSDYAQSTEHLSKSARNLSDSYTQTASIIADSGQSISDQIKQSVSDLTQHLNESGSTIVGSYQKLSDSLQNDFEKILKNSGNYSQQLESMNNTLSSLNSVYELQLNQSNEQIQKAQGMHKDLNQMVENLSTSLENVRSYRKETEQVNKNLQALNTIYGNMLSVMSNNKKRS